jgi:hypothetical protein
MNEIDAANNPDTGQLMSRPQKKQKQGKTKKKGHLFGAMDHGFKKQGKKTHSKHRITKR